MSEDAGTLVIAIARSYSALFSQIEKDVRQYGLTVNEFGVLEALFHKGELPVQKLSETILVTSGSMTYILKKLEDQDYLKRYKSDLDARIWNVRLTEKGQDFMQQIYPLHEDFLKKTLGGMTKSEQKNLIQALIHMKNVIEKSE